MMDRQNPDATNYVPVMRTEEVYEIADTNTATVATRGPQTDLDIAVWADLADRATKYDQWSNGHVAMVPAISNKERKKRTAKKKAAKQSRKRNRK